MRLLLSILFCGVILLCACPASVTTLPAETIFITSTLTSHTTTTTTVTQTTTTTTTTGNETTTTVTITPATKTATITLPPTTTTVTQTGSVIWDVMQQITDTGAPSFFPTLGVNGSTIHLVWVDQRDGGENREIYYNRSVDSGASWQPADTRISNDPLFSIRTDFAVSGDTVHLFWRDNRDGNFEEYYARSMDGGLSWGPETRLTNSPGLSGCPFPVVDGDTLNMFFRDNRSGTFKIYQMRSADAGESWSPEILLTPDGIMAEFPYPAVNGNTIHLVWRDNRDGNAEIYYKRSDDGGLNWTADRRLTDDAAESEHPKIVVSGNILHLVWRDNRDGSYQVYYKRSTDNGQNWSDDTRLSYNPGQSYWPVLAVSDNLVHLLWCNEHDGIQYLNYMHSTDGGLNWTGDILLTDCVLPLGACLMGAHPIAVSDSYIHIVFNADWSGDNEVYYLRGRVQLLTG